MERCCKNCVYLERGDSYTCKHPITVFLKKSLILIKDIENTKCELYAELERR